MNAGLGWGLALVVVGGFLNGSFAVPMKKMPAWRWENTWLLYSLVGMVIVPWILAAWTIPHLGGVYAAAAWPNLAKVALFGLGWGVGSTLFGLGIDRVGMALGFAIILGVTASVGSLLPLLVLSPGELWTRRGYALLAGLALVVLGILFSSIAGGRRERDLAANAQRGLRSGFGAGMVICLFSGIFSAMLNFSFVFGRELQQLSLVAGAHPAMAANSTWVLALGAGFLANAGYCVFLLRKNRTWRTFRAEQASAAYWLRALVMGVIWFAGIAVYGMGGSALGPLGGVLGWPVFMAMVIVAANLWGAVTGEWKGTSRGAYIYSLTGIATLLVAIYIISRGSGV